MKTKMKAVKLLLVCLFITGLSHGQSNKEDVEMIQAMFGKEKKDIVQAYMTIPDSQKDSFWTTYDAYETERKDYGKKRIALIEDYASSFSSLTDEKAIELMNKKMDIYNSYGKLQKKYFDKFKKIIGGRESAKLFQLEDYIENVIRISIQEEIPFIGELDLTKTK